MSMKIRDGWWYAFHKATAITACAEPEIVEVRGRAVWRHMGRESKALILDRVTADKRIKPYSHDDFDFKEPVVPWSGAEG